MQQQTELLRQPRYTKAKFCLLLLVVYFMFVVLCSIAGCSDLARLVRFISSETSWQGVQSACTGLPGSVNYSFNIQSLSEETYMVETTRAWKQTPNYTTPTMPTRRGKQQIYSRVKPTDIIINEPQRYDCPKWHAHIYILGKSNRIPVLLDSLSNIFLINEKLVKDLHLPYHSPADAVQIEGFTGDEISSGGSHFPKPVYLEIGINKHLSLVSCEIAAAGKYGMSIPFGWWHEEHPIKNIADPRALCFNDTNCQLHLVPENEGSSVEWDEDVRNDPNAVVIGTIERIDEETITIIDHLPDQYHHYQDLFWPSTAEKLAPAIPLTRPSISNEIPNHLAARYIRYYRNSLKPFRYTLTIYSNKESFRPASPLQAPQSPLYQNQTVGYS